MTRDHWMRLYAMRLMKKANLDSGEAAACAAEAANDQNSRLGRDPTRWENPADAADEEISYWDE